MPALMMVVKYAEKALQLLTIGIVLLSRSTESEISGTPGPLLLFS